VKSSLFFILALILSPTALTIPRLASTTELIAQDISPQFQEPEFQEYAQSISVKIDGKNNGGSGVIIQQQNNRYLVLTNNHVVRSEDSLTIQTADGITHQANLVSNATTTNDDLALLTFVSNNSYKVAMFRNKATEQEEQAILAVGYSADTGDLVFKPGKINRILDRSFKEGYQIGYTSDIVSGMSGGAILNHAGDLIGIHGISAFPIFDTAYVYQDGTIPPEAEIELYRQLSWGISFNRLLTQLNPEVIANYGLPLPETTANIKNTELRGWLAELETKAKQITVRIDSSSDANGSGVIIAKEGSTYTVLTANHVICEKGKSVETEDCIDYVYKLLAPDGEEYTLDKSTFRGQEGVDLATLQFTSDKNYQTAELADYSLQDDDAVFVAGYPNFSQKSQKANLLFSLGYGLSQEAGFADLYDRDLATDNLASSRVSVGGGYGLVYTNITYGGMSGGAVLDKDGRVIGIHGLAEGEQDKELLVGYGLGVPIATFLSLRERLEITPNQLQLQNNPPTQLSQQEKDDFEAAVLNVKISRGNAQPTQLLERASQLLKLRRYQEALEPVERAISIIETQPESENLYLALLGKGLIYWELEEAQAALENINLSIDANPNFATTFHNKAWLLMDLERYEEALNTIERAIALEQPNTNYYVLKGQILLNLEEYSAAETAYTQAIALSPRADLYNIRGLIYFELQEWEKAETDYSQAVEVNPEYFFAYVNRGYLYDQQGKPENAIADYSQAIKIDPQLIAAYINRGEIYVQQQQWDKAEADYAKAISFNVPESGFAYLNRGTMYINREQWDKALADLDRAIAIALELELDASYDNELARAYFNRGESYIGLQQPDKALNDFSQAIALNPQLAKAYNHRGFMYLQQEKYDLALADFQQAIALDPNLAVSYMGLGSVQGRTGDIEAARNNLQRSQQLFTKQGNTVYAEQVADLLKQLP